MRKFLTTKLNVKKNLQKPPKVEIIQLHVKII